MGGYLAIQNANNAGYASAPTTRGRAHKKESKKEAKKESKKKHKMKGRPGAADGHDAASSEAGPSSARPATNASKHRPGTPANTIDTDTLTYTTTTSTSTGNSNSNPSAPEPPQNRPFTPPKFVVDLSKPPGERYDHVAAHIREALGGGSSGHPGALHHLLKGLLSDGCRQLWLPRGLATALRLAAHPVLRRVYDDEEQAELEGLARAADVPLHLLVAFNVMADMMMGCSSGGVRTLEELREGDPGSNTQEADAGSRMIHFRTMDWAMPALRRLVVELDFVRRPGGPAVASSLTYFGYVGVVTGVRRGLSMSVNFRATHARGTARQRLAYRKHQLCVLLGRRRSVASVLRHLLLTPDPGLDWGEAAGATTSDMPAPAPPAEDPLLDYILKNLPSEAPPTPKPAPTAPLLDYIINKLPGEASTAAYLLFCTPQTTYLLEKDHRSACVVASATHLTVCNHDQEDGRRIAELAGQATRGLPAALRETLRLSVRRTRALRRVWYRGVHECAAELVGSGSGSGSGQGASASAPQQQSTTTTAAEEEGEDQTRGTGGAVKLRHVVQMVQDPAICHDTTHYVAIMDPEQGEILWREAYL